MEEIEHSEIDEYDKEYSINHLNSIIENHQENIEYYYYGWW